MKKCLLFITAVLLCTSTMAQEKLYLLFEFMKVDNEQEAAYMETEEFWQKIHEHRARNGEIQGWDLWKLLPGGEMQNFQYMTVTLFADPAQMMKGTEDYNALLKASYPNSSQEELDKKMESSVSSRDLAVRVYLEELDRTEDNFDVPLGTVAAINMMKVSVNGFANYEKVESEVYKPWHQEAIKKNLRESWSLLRFISPYGSDTYATHITIDMYEDFEQYFRSHQDEATEISFAQMQQMTEGLASRDLKYQYMGTLIKRVRP